jgi:hypothetical protein
MSPRERPSVTIEHALPGRLRLSMSHRVREPARLERLLTDHAGVGEVRYTPLTRSFLVRYDPAAIAAEELVVRVAIGMSLEHDARAVRILARPDPAAWTDSAYYAGLALLAALGLRLVPGSPGRRGAMDWVASLTTAGATLEHGWREYRRQGNFDPEVLAVTYLLTALLRGNPLPAAIGTWLMTFARHLVQPPPPSVEVRPVEVGGDGTVPRFEVVVTPDRPTPEERSFLGVLAARLVTALTGASPGGSLLEEIRRVSNQHDQVLEAVSEFQEGIPLRIR